MKAKMWKVSKQKVTERKRALKRLNLSLREIARDLFGNEISFQTLGRFIHEKNYIPKGQKVCELLDIVAEDNPYRILPRWYHRTKEALAFFNQKREQIKSMALEARKQSRAWLN